MGKEEEEVYPGKQFTEEAVNLIRGQLLSAPQLAGLKEKLEELAGKLEAIKENKTFLRTDRGARLAEGVLKKLQELKDADSAKAADLFAAVETEAATLVEKCRTMVIRMT